MKRQEVIILVAAVAVIAFIGVRANANASVGNAHGLVKAGLVDATVVQHSVRAASPWDTSAFPKYANNTWTCPPWSMASVGCTPLRSNHPLHKRPNYCGEERHKVMTNGWYYCNPGNEVL